MSFFFSLILLVSMDRIWSLKLLLLIVTNSCNDLASKSMGKVDKKKEMCEFIFNVNLYKSRKENIIDFPIIENYVSVQIKLLGF